MMDLYAHVFLTAYYKKVNNTIKTTKNLKIQTEGKRYLHNKNLKSLLTISQEALINITARQWIGKYMQNLHGDKCFDDFKNMLEKVFDANNILPDSRNINLYSNFIEHGRDGFRTWEIQMYLQLCRSIKTQRDNERILLDLFIKTLHNSKPVHLNVPFEEPLSEFSDQPTITISNETKYSIKKDDLSVFNSPLIKGYKKIMILFGCANKGILSESTIDKLSSCDNIVVLKETTSNLNNTSFFGKIDQLIAPAELNENSSELFNKLKPELLITVGGMIISKKIK